MSSTGSDPHRERAARLQERFDFYLIASTFTVLGLSVQTAKGKYLWQRWLLVIGLTGLTVSRGLNPLFGLFDYQLK